MARFDLSKYATVAERIQLLYAAYPTALIQTENLTTKADRERGQWVVKAELWLPTDIDVPYSKNPGYYLKSTGHAFEIDGGAGANATSALENAESSAVGRCLALAGWSANKDEAANSLASRAEMEKVERGRQRDWVAEADALALTYNVEGLRLLYADAVAAKVDKETLAKIKDYGTNAAKP